MTYTGGSTEVGPWGELLALLRAGQKPYASVTMLDGRCYLGRVIKLAEGWVKLVVRGEEVWVSMDAISTWALVDE